MFVWSDFQLLILFWTIAIMVESLFLNLPGWASIAVVALLAGLYLGLTLLRRYAPRPAADDPALARRMAALCKAVGRPDLEVAVIRAKTPYLEVQGKRVQVSPLLGQLLNDNELKAMLIQGLSKGWSWRSLIGWDLATGLLFVGTGIILAVIYHKPFTSITFPLALLSVLAVSRSEELHTWTAMPEAQRFVALGGDPVALSGALLKLCMQDSMLAALAPSFRPRLLALGQVKPETAPKLAPALKALAPNLKRMEYPGFVWGITFAILGALAALSVWRVL